MKIVQERLNEMDDNKLFNEFKIGMMQGFRILQSYLSSQQQEVFGFNDRNKMNNRLENEYQSHLRQKI